MEKLLLCILLLQLLLGDSQYTAWEIKLLNTPHLQTHPLLHPLNRKNILVKNIVYYTHSYL